MRERCHEDRAVGILAPAYRLIGGDPRLTDGDEEFPMSEMLTIVARIEARPDRVELVRTELSKLVEPTLDEKRKKYHVLPE